MGKSVVVFDHVSKRFCRGERHDSLRDLLPSLARRVLGKTTQVDEQEFWALKNVSFEVGQGEALGIIGRNGAGKSTTLKLLTKILKPNKGFCSVRGRVGALIEVAAGFHPDLTGRENIYLQGAIMGMRRADISQKLDAIIDFAGIGEFLDTPVKRYSSGMNARLGFSIAAHLDPDVLVIDEVLAVGDRTFQQRCQDRMVEFRRHGVAIVFVSHNLDAVLRLCERTLLLDHGRAITLGPSSDVVSKYVAAEGATQGAVCEARTSEVSVAARVPGHEGSGIWTLTPEERVSLEVDIEFHVARVPRRRRARRRQRGDLGHGPQSPDLRVQLRSARSGGDASTPG
jgi:ABC-type polysaccharide/polyol phosphate transport system ATPase subunit